MATLALQFALHSSDSAFQGYPYRIATSPSGVSEDPNSGPQTCAASPLTAEPSPESQKEHFMSPFVHFKLPELFFNFSTSLVLLPGE